MNEAILYGVAGMLVAAAFAIQSLSVTVQTLAKTLDSLLRVKQSKRPRRPKH